MATYFADHFTDSFLAPIQRGLERQVFVPRREGKHIMISYQWADQPMVLKVMQQSHGIFDKISYGSRLALVCNACYVIVSCFL